MKSKISDTIKIPFGLAYIANQQGILNEIANYYKLKAASEDGFFHKSTYIYQLTPIFNCKPTSVYKIINKLVKLKIVRKDFNGYSVVSLDKLCETFGYNMKECIGKSGKRRKGNFPLHNVKTDLLKDNFKDNIQLLDPISNLGKQKTATYCKLSLDERYKDTASTSLKKNVYKKANMIFRDRCAKVVQENLVQTVKLNDEAKYVTEYQELTMNGNEKFCNLDITLSVRGVNRILGHKSLSTTFNLLKRWEDNGLLYVERRNLPICDCDSYSSFKSLNLDTRYFRYDHDNKSVYRVLSNKLTFL